MSVEELKTLIEQQRLDFQDLRAELAQAQALVDAQVPAADQPEMDSQPSGALPQIYGLPRWRRALIIRVQRSPPILPSTIMSSRPSHSLDGMPRGHLQPGSGELPEAQGGTPQSLRKIICNGSTPGRYGRQKVILHYYLHPDDVW